MLDTLLLLAAGAFIGWNFPQPTWAKWVQDWVTAKYHKLVGKDES